MEKWWKLLNIPTTVCYRSVCFTTQSMSYLAFTMSPIQHRTQAVSVPGYIFDQYRSLDQNTLNIFETISYFGLIDLLIVLTRWNILCQMLVTELINCINLVSSAAIMNIWKINGSILEIFSLFESVYSVNRYRWSGFLCSFSWHVIFIKCTKYKYL